MKAPWQREMISSPHVGSLLVVDLAGDLEDDLARHLSGLADVVVGSPPLDKALSRPHLAALVRAETDSAARNRALLLALAGSLGDAPVIVVASDIGLLDVVGAHFRGPIHFLQFPIVPELLKSQVALLADLCGLRARLAACEDQLVATRRDRNDEIHRTKNMLAIVQSIALRTVNDGRAVVQSRELLLGRLRALSRAYHLTVTSAGTGTDLAELIDVELGDVAHRVSVRGPRVRLQGTVVQTLALAIHELADNAIRHGALGNAQGSADIGWTYVECGTDRYVEIAWRERGGPILNVPPPYGFGLALIVSFAGGTSDANVHFSEGFACRMRIRHDAIVQG